MRSATARFRTPAPSTIVLLGMLALAAAFAGTGFGATTATVTPHTNVVAGLTITDPSNKTADPPLCTNTLAPLDTDDCSDVAFTASPKTLNLGSLAGTDVQAAGLTFKVTTTNPLGYRVYLGNAGTAPVLQSTGGSIADMQSAPFVPASAVPNATQFGVAMGDPTNDNQAAVDYPGSPWIAAGSQQGELFRGVPASLPGIVIAERNTPQSNDPFTITFAAASVAGQTPAVGAYTGLLRVTAQAL